MYTYRWEAEEAHDVKMVDFTTVITTGALRFTYRTVMTSVNPREAAAGYCMMI